MRAPRLEYQVTVVPEGQVWRWRVDFVKHFQYSGTEVLESVAHNAFSAQKAEDKARQWVEAHKAERARKEQERREREAQIRSFTIKA